MVGLVQPVTATATATAHWAPRCTFNGVPLPGFDPISDLCSHTTAWLIAVRAMAHHRLAHCSTRDGTPPLGSLQYARWQYYLPRSVPRQLCAKRRAGEQAARLVPSVVQTAVALTHRCGVPGFGAVRLSFEATFQRTLYP
jgi:hypothetical protein